MRTPGRKSAPNERGVGLQSGGGRKVGKARGGFIYRMQKKKSGEPHFRPAAKGLHGEVGFFGAGKKTREVRGGNPKRARVQEKGVNGKTREQRGDLAPKEIAASIPMPKKKA